MFLISLIYPSDAHSAGLFHRRHRSLRAFTLLLSDWWIGRWLGRSLAYLPRIVPEDYSRVLKVPKFNALRVYSGNRNATGLRGDCFFFSFVVLLKAHLVGLPGGELHGDIPVLRGSDGYALPP